MIEIIDVQEGVGLNIMLTEQPRGSLVQVLLESGTNLEEAV